jgi:predicted SprT family Zn-dependent metalloprotease
MATTERIFCHRCAVWQEHLLRWTYRERNGRETKVYRCSACGRHVPVVNEGVVRNAQTSNPSADIRSVRRQS